MRDASISSWAPRSAWAGVASVGRIGKTGAPGVVATLRDGYGLATLIATAGGEAALAKAVKVETGLELPQRPIVHAAGARAAIWAGPGQWLLRADTRTGFSDLLAALAPFGAVSEQSQARAGFRVSGPHARDALAKGCMIDLHPKAFPVGSTALTSIAHMGVHIWRTDDDADGASFELLVARSMVGSFWSWFAASAAEFGCDVVGPKA